jgi:1-aminocyclopropane-1-carboxylate deaminase/D-cysteine desulfhydrase-like pyridoxal-dependent ACC family enzyme
MSETKMIIKAPLEKIEITLTFGGDYSNHLYSFSNACRENKIHSIGIIRGKDFEWRMGKRGVPRFKS